MNYVAGKPVRGEIASADASAGVSFTLYDGNGVAVTLGSTERILISDIDLSSDTAMRAEVFFGADATVDDGERLFAAYFGANGGASKSFTQPEYVPAGRTPRLRTSASGNIRAIFNGVIIKA